MVNMNVQWVGPNFSLSTLTKEITARFGAPSRPYEYVTGYKSPYNVTGHNADANGRGHSVDIFVGPGQNISSDQGIDLAERLRVEGTKGTILGHPDRLAYIIHRGRIAGDHTNWQWVKYNGLDDHNDHIHVSSVFDYYWGDPVAGSPLDYNSTLAWNLWSDNNQEDDLAVLSAITEEAMLNLQGMVLGAVTAATAPILQRLTETQESVAWQEKFAVKSFEKLSEKVGASLSEEELEEIKTAVREELAAGVHVTVGGGK